MLTEQEIQKAFFAHLREFYRYRFEYEPGTFQESTDSLAAGDIIADGMIAFQKPDGERFMGTFEATSVSKADEVKFKTNTQLFLWDCFAFASIFSCIGFSFLYFFKYHTLAALGIAGMVGFLFTCFLLSFSIWYFGMSNWRKYRYIYAIEQFKQYFADEQWIALGHDLFPNPNDPFFLELRDQCTFSGFGLVSIDYQGGVRVICTPSRLGLYGRDRKEADWLTGSTAFTQMRDKWNTIPSAPGPFKALYNTIARPLRFLIFQPLQNIAMRLLTGDGAGRSKEFDRFMKSYSYQKGITLLGFALSGVLFMKTIRSDQFHTEEEFDVLSQFNERRSDKTYFNPEDEPSYVLEEKLPITHGAAPGIPKQYPEQKKEAPIPPKVMTKPVANSGIETDEPSSTAVVAKNDTQKVQEIDLSALREEEPTPPKIESPTTHATDNTSKSTTSTAKGIVKTAAPTLTMWEWCTRLQGKEGYLIQDNFFISKESAEFRLKELRGSKITCFMVPASCLEAEMKGYYVFLNDVCPSENTASDQLTSVTSALKKAKLQTGRTIVRKWSGQKTTKTKQ